MAEKELTQEQINEQAAKDAVERGELAPEPEPPKNELKSQTVTLRRVAGGGQQFGGYTDHDEDASIHDHAVLVHLDAHTFDGLGAPEAISVTIKAAKAD